MSSVALATAWCLWVSRRAGGARLAVASLTSLVLLLACTSAGVATNIRSALCEDTAGAIARLKQQLPTDARLVSLGQISHLFAYHYGGLIPVAQGTGGEYSLGPEDEFFCFNRLQGQSFELPFAWEPIAVVSLDRTRRPVPERTVVVGRRVFDSDLASAEER